MITTKSEDLFNDVFALLERSFWPSTPCGVMFSDLCGQQFEHGFDEIGNRTVTGGRASSQSLYTVNRQNHPLQGRTER